MTKFSWVVGDAPSGTRISQVYGFLFADDGRILLRAEGGKYSLPGGRPEVFDVDHASVLRREAKEEVNAEIGDAILIGFQQVEEEDGTAPYAQLRMVARIDALGARQPDPDTGRTYGRVLATWSRCAELLSWGDVGERQVKLAHATAMREFGLPSDAPDVLTNI
jgi:8-oxo-dGTP diphosphatase